MRIIDKITVPARIDYLYKSMHFVSSCAIRQGFHNNDIRRLELATEEALVNIFKHAYGEGGGDVEVSCLADQDKFFIEIRDWGASFNMLSLPDPVLTADAERSSIGGFGVLMIKSFMDDVRYRREAQTNILTLVVSKRL
jgi:anti-sigma regulatory factor (Ser/Thr protein kinase)